MTTPYLESASPVGAPFGRENPGAVPLTKYSGQWNWGAFGVCPFWLMNHGKIWTGVAYIVAALIPILGSLVTLAMAIYFGIKGNDVAVRNRVFRDEAQFVAVQNAWRNWGIGLLLFGIIFGVLVFTTRIMHPHVPPAPV